jgi:ribosomal protein L11 methyltransferase
MGVRRIDAIDTEEGAVERAGRNIELNGCGGIALVRGDIALLTGAGTYDLISANLLSDIIIAHIKQLARLLKSDGTLIASGVIDRWDAQVRKCFEDNGLELIEHDRLGGWNGYVIKPVP